MILTSIIFGAVLTAGIVGVVAAFWNDIIDFLKKGIDKVRQIVDGIVYGSKVFVKKIYEGIQEISRHYSMVDDRWQETTVTRTVSPNEVPDDILRRAEMQKKEVDITDELELNIQHQKNIDKVYSEKGIQTMFGKILGKRLTQESMMFSW